MTRLLNPFRRLVNPSGPPPGIYHYQAPPDDPRNYRLHLRLEPQGGGVLIVNAATVLHLNQTAAEYAYHLVHNHPPDMVGREIAKRYRISQEQARWDYTDLSERIQTLIETPDLDPITFLDFERQIPYSGQISAPYRLDCALTYRLPVGTPQEAAPHDRVKNELETSEWREILDIAWAAGIPHVVFTGGEPTLREDLVSLIEHAENNGQISGLITDGFALTDDAYMDDLLQTGLDHLMLILRPERAESWRAIENALVEDLFVAVHVTLSADNITQAPNWLDKLSRMGIHEISLSQATPDLTSKMEEIRQQIASLELDLVWSLPVPYSELHPVALELSGLKVPEGSGSAWLYIEPDGDVLPTQGINKVLGNLLKDSWAEIWANASDYR